MVTHLLQATECPCLESTHGLAGAEMKRQQIRGGESSSHISKLADVRPPDSGHDDEH